jgi:5-formyltetrahydrofolate cyclo-ligase
MSAEAIRRRKRALRRAMVERILALDPLGRSRDEAMLVDRFPSLPGFAEASTVLIYVTAFPEEIATRPMLTLAHQRGKVVLCPRVDRAERRLRLFRVDDPGRDLEPGMLGIPEPRPTCPEVEPEAVDWILVPGLAFDARGYRLGRGAGHYDRLLPRLRPEVSRWALILDCQWVKELPIEPHDIPVDGVVSPGREILGRRDSSPPSSAPPRDDRTIPRLD